MTKKQKALWMLVRRDIHDLEYSPAAQYKFNRFWAIFWALQMPAVLILLFIFPRFWAAIAIVYVTEASLWANFATHFSGMSSALAAEKEQPSVRPARELAHLDWSVPAAPAARPR